MAEQASSTSLLVQRVQEGDQAAVSELLDRHRDRIRRMVSVRMDRRLRARIDPSDVVQDVLAEAFQEIAAKRQDCPQPFYPWLRRLAWDRLSRLYEHHYRASKRSVLREQRAPVALPDESALDLAECVLADQPSPSSVAVREEMRRRVQQAVHALPDNDREVLILRFLEQLSTEETAQVLGLSDSAVKSRQFRAIRRLHSELKSTLEEDVK